MRWTHHIKIKHLLTKSEDHNSIQKSMSAIHDVITASDCFILFPQEILKKFKHIPKGDAIISPCDYANKLLALVYDYADSNSIWIE